ncbi:hypothetical protein QKT49_gp443 [Acanthamoeba castellanii medusavirus]|uniref:Uncharacterized protein n=1 Tax=Acanthamoeba castellanii medusavirus J1 TaxID=3114988 RepID=A0A3T1CWV7_9VIRU|nr:hypothetical protein QKT49_gp443 [Acanthamoeba castellanii medusavirus]BBI30320.1 hypothetical protein [Acanthamoeba castellanii medusavirus J1]
MDAPPYYQYAPSQQPVTWGPPLIRNGESPLQTLDSRGNTQPPRATTPGVMAPRIVTLDSRDRNRASHTSARNFKLKLQHKNIQLVRSIELLEAVIPVLSVPTSATDTTPETYVVMDIKVGGKVLESGIISAQASDATQNPASSHNAVSEEAFAHFIIADALAVGAPYLVWKSNNQHRLVRRFPEALTRLDEIEVTFKVRRDSTTSSLYPLAEEPVELGTSPLNNVFLKFEIVAAK